MTKSFKDKNTEQLHAGGFVSAFKAFQRQAEKRLRVLDAADTIDALMLLPSNRFKALGGDRQGQFNIRINDQWRICFKWHDDSPHDVEIVDYHSR